MIKSIYEKANTVLDGERLKTFPSKIRHKTRNTDFTTSFNIVQEAPTREIRQVKEIKHMWKHSREKNYNYPICGWHGPMYRKSWRIHKKLLELINEFSTFAAYMSNPQKIGCFYTNYKQYEGIF